MDLSDAIAQQGLEVIQERYGNLFEMYQRITGEDAYKTPMRIYPAPHYTMGGLWVDYNLMSTVPGLFVIGEANFADHGANRLGASSCMVSRTAISFFPIRSAIIWRPRSAVPSGQVIQMRAAEERVTNRIARLLRGRGRQTAASYHRSLGRLMWDLCGMAREEAGLKKALGSHSGLARGILARGRGARIGSNVQSGTGVCGTVADFLEYAELLCYDALHREESCGAHFREEHQTPFGEPLRDDANFSYVSAWEYVPNGQPVLHKEPLVFEFVKPTMRTYQ